MTNASGMNLHNFLYRKTPTFSTWIIKQSGYRVAIFYIDGEDLWSRWFPEQHIEAKIKSYTYDEATMTGRIELE